MATIDAFTKFQPMTIGDDTGAPPSKQGKSDKRMSVERIYQKKTQLEHILLRPDTYIGSVEPVTQAMWVYDGEESGMVHREVTFVPGLYKIFDEIIVNAADNKQRDKNMDTLKIDIDPENCKIVVYNNGEGIPVVEHKDEKMFVPTLIFGHLLTSSNYNDDEKKVTGGRNGYGAKLCNIFSSKFVVETSYKKEGKCFKQEWTSNMTKTAEPKVKAATASDFTRITFHPDLRKFGMEELDKDIVALMTRRIYDLAGTSKGVKVFLNGTRLPIKNYKEYVDLYIKGKQDENGDPLKTIYENVNERWEVALTSSEKGFQQVSFVNSIATTKGGRHVDYVVDQIVGKLIEVVKKKNKSGIQIKPFQVKNHIWVFVNCLIENPTFDSQTKENMTLQAKSFGSKCQLGEKFVTQSVKCGIVESILAWCKFKSETNLNKKCHASKHSKLKGIPKLDDANDAGTKKSTECTMILTEGDSAKTLAVSGFSVVGRDKYGVFPLKGKLLNVREASTKQVADNAEIQNVVKILGLQYNKKYDNAEDLKSLRYGKLMIMTDQDQDGSHIKGLLINFIHHKWPTLLKQPFLEEFITPIVKVSKGKEKISFFSLPEFEDWKKGIANIKTWNTKYYKGLGTSTADEAREYFSDMQRHRIRFKYQGTADDNSIELAFSKKMVEQRKEWLTNFMGEKKTRRELGLPETYLYNKDTKSVTYEDFVNKELVLFSNMDNERSISSLVDGLKPGSRKVIFACMKRNIVKETKVAQLSGSVAEISSYHHGENSLQMTIINLAQNFVGSNNINLLVPNGQFGTRLQGGKDHSAARYIFTQLSTLTPHIFNKLDAPLLNHLYDDNKRIEPEYYVPIIPMVLVNGAEGIGTGWMTRIHNYNPRDIVDNIRRMINDEEPENMIPWFKNFRGTIVALDGGRFLVSGEVSVINEKSIEITELPVRVWTQTFKDGTLEPMLAGGEKDKSPPIISDYKDYSTDMTVRFVVTMSEDKLMKFEDEGLHKAFKLFSSLTTTSMVLFDANGCLKRYETVTEIMKEFYDVRLKFYVLRKNYMIGLLSAEALKLENQARFILEKIEGKVTVENKKKNDVFEELQRRGYDSDPIKTWEKLQKQAAARESDSDSEDAEEEVAQTGPDFQYLVSMQIMSLSREKKEELLRKRDEKRAELEALKKKTPKDLWTDDLDAFMAELDRVEAAEREAAANQPQHKSTQAVKGGAAGRARKLALPETQPTPNGRRVEPRIDSELRKKYDKATEGGKKRKGTLKSQASTTQNEDDSDKELELSLSDRLGVSPDMVDGIAPPAKKKKTMKQGTLDFSKGVKRANAKKSAADSDDVAAPGGAKPRKPRGPRKPAAEKGSPSKKKRKKSWGSSDSESEAVESDVIISDSENDDAFVSDDDDKPPKKVVPRATTARTMKKLGPNPSEQSVFAQNGNGVTKSNTNGITFSDSDSDVAPKAKSKAAPSVDISDDDSDDYFSSRVTKKDPPVQMDLDDFFKPKTSTSSVTTAATAAPIAEKKKTTSTSSTAAAKKPAPPKKSVVISDSEDGGSVKIDAFSDDDSFVVNRPKKSTAAPKARKPAAPKKKKVFSDSDDSDSNNKKKKKKSTKDDYDFDMSDGEKDDFAPPRKATERGGGRARAAVKYNFSDSD